MLRIGEFASLTSISIHMLRHYDKIGLLTPEHVDAVNGYRYYDRKQLVQANRIVALKELGFGLEEIMESKSMNQTELNTLLHRKKEEINQEILRLENQMSRIGAALETDMQNKQYALSVVTKRMPAMQVASYKGSIVEYPQEGLLWHKLNRECANHRIMVEEHAFAMAINHGILDESGTMDVEVMLSIKSGEETEKVHITSIPEREVASVAFSGSYSQIGMINSYVAEWMEKNQYQIQGEVFSIYHNSPGNQTSEQDFVTELCFPISKK